VNERSEEKNYIEDRRPPAVFCRELQEKGKIGARNAKKIWDADRLHDGSGGLLQPAGEG
jgi:hypothetical protein